MVWVWFEFSGFEVGCLDWFGVVCLGWVFGFWVVWILGVWWVVGWFGFDGFGFWILGLWTSWDGLGWHDCWVLGGCCEVCVFVVFGWFLCFWMVGRVGII